MQLFLCVPALAVGLGGLAWAVALLLLARTVRSWPITTGRVVESRVKDVPSDDGPSYAPGIFYEYSVEGKKFASTALSPGGIVRSGQASWVKRTVARYPVGSTVEVHYHPATPSRAYIEVWPRAFWFVFLFGAAFTAAGIVAARAVLRE